jgi:serine beta-lactamase-like protein LACTB, mitochondrial
MYRGVVAAHLLLKVVKGLVVVLGSIVVLALAYLAVQYCRTERATQKSIRAVGTADPLYAASIERARKILDDRSVSFPGIAIAVAVGDRIVWSEARGYADLGRKLAARPDTLFPIYSASKAITGTAAQKLVEEGKLRLDATVGTYLPEAPAPLKDVPVSNVVSHTAGIRDYWPFEWYWVSCKHCATTTEALRFFINDELDFEPGSQFGYSSYEYVLLSAIMERAAGKPFNDLLDSEVFQPAGMRSASLASLPGAASDRAVFYDQGLRGGFIPQRWIDNSCKYGAGGIWATSEDLARFGSAILGGKIISKEGVGRIFTSFKTADGKPVDYGMGWGVNKAVGTHRYAGHSGGGLGGRAAIVVFPDDGVAVGIAANFEGPRVVDDAATIGYLFIDAAAVLPTGSP